jgi:hypothetical protein
MEKGEGRERRRASERKKRRKAKKEGERTHDTRDGGYKHRPPNRAMRTSVKRGNGDLSSEDVGSGKTERLKEKKGQYEKGETRRRERTLAIMK